MGKFLFKFFFRLGHLENGAERPSPPHEIFPPTQGCCNVPPWWVENL